MTKALDQAAFDQLFLEARTQNAWKEGEISDETLRRLFDIVKMGPTSANCSPARYVFVKSPEAKERLKPHLSGGNLEKTMSAPVTVIIANDMEFYEHLPNLFPHTDAKSWFTSNDDLIRETAFRNATLQGGYMIIAARALGLDCGPMSGFDQAGVDEEFFKGTTYKSNFLLNLGQGDTSALFQRSPRFEFDEIASIL
jgi:3-hydroxypropanoate dehydrogenase